MYPTKMLFTIFLITSSLLSHAQEFIKFTPFAAPSYPTTFINCNGLYIIGSINGKLSITDKNLDKKIDVSLVNYDDDQINFVKCLDSLNLLIMMQQGVVLLFNIETQLITKSVTLRDVNGSSGANMKASVKSGKLYVIGTARGGALSELIWKGYVLDINSFEYEAYSLNLKGDLIKYFGTTQTGELIIILKEFYFFDQNHVQFLILDTQFNITSSRELPDEDYSLYRVSYINDNEIYLSYFKNRRFYFFRADLLEEFQQLFAMNLLDGRTLSGFHKKNDNLFVMLEHYAPGPFQTETAIVYFDNRGNKLWSKQILVPNSIGEYMTTVRFKENGNLVIIGAMNTWNETTGSNTFIGELENIIVNVTREKSEVISVYPNPTSSILTIEADILVEDIMIFDAIGSLVFCQAYNTKTIDISGLPKGVYFLQLVVNEKVFNKKILRV